jgi:hypothetical protein
MLLVTYVDNEVGDFGENLKCGKEEIGSVKIYIQAVGLHPEHDSFIVQKSMVH